MSSKADEGEEEGIEEPDPDIVTEEERHDQSKDHHEPYIMERAMDDSVSLQKKDDPEPADKIHKEMLCRKPQ